MNKVDGAKALTMLCSMFNEYFDAKRPDLYVGIEFSIIQLSYLFDIEIVEDEEFHKQINPLKLYNEE